jgi:hypothetical protein
MQGFSQAIEGRPKIFWVDAGFAGDGHEIGIANPAGQHVKVQVAGHPGAGSLAQIHPEVHAIGFVFFAIDRFEPLRQF